MERQEEKIEQEEQDLNAKEKDLAGRAQGAENSMSISRNSVALPDDLDTYRGYFGEAERRFQERQREKSIAAVRKRVEEIRRLFQEGVEVEKVKVELERAKAELAKARHAAVNVHKEIELADLQREVEREEAQIRLGTAKLRGQAEQKRLEAEIAELEAKLKGVPRQETAEPEETRKVKDVIRRINLKKMTIDQVNILCAQAYQEWREQVGEEEAKLNLEFLKQEIAKILFEEQ